MKNKSHHLCYCRIIICKLDQVGIVSWGIGCGTTTPGAYSNVSDAACFIDWATRYVCCMKIRRKLSKKVFIVPRYIILPKIHFNFWYFCNDLRLRLLHTFFFLLLSHDYSRKTNFFYNFTAFWAVKNWYLMIRLFKRNLLLKIYNTILLLLFPLYFKGV